MFCSQILDTRSEQLQFDIILRKLDHFLELKADLFENTDRPLIFRIHDRDDTIQADRILGVLLDSQRRFDRVAL